MSKTNDPESAEIPGSTRRSFLQKTGAGAAALAAYPMSHEGGDDGGWFSGLFSSAVDLTVMHDGEVVSHSLEELNIEGTAITEVTEVNAYDGRIRVTINGGGGGGAFEDTDGDGVAELQDDHVDMQGGDVLNGRNMGASGNPMGTAYVTSIDGDGDNVDVSPGLGATSITDADVTNHFGLLDRVYTSDGDVYDATWSGITSANSDLDTAGGGTIYVPPGTYNPTSTLTVGTDVYITGPPEQGPRKQESKNYPVFQPSGDVQPFDLPNSSTTRGGLANMVIDGVNTTSAGGVHTSGIVRLSSVTIKNFAGRGWYQRGGVGSVSYDVEILGCGTGYQADGSQNADGGNSTTHFRMYISNCDVNIRASGEGYQMYGLTNQGANTTGIEFNGGDRWEIHSWEESHPAGAYIDFGAGSTGNEIHVRNVSITPSDITGNTSDNQVRVAGRRLYAGGRITDGFQALNLSGRTGDFTGQVMMDDGTNVSTSGPMLCVWTGSAWQPSDGGATFT